LEEGEKYCMVSSNIPLTVSVINVIIIIILTIIIITIIIIILSQ
jgi:hypothetical protein